MKSLKKGRIPLERALSKLGILSRTEAKAMILEGHIRANGIIRRDPKFLITPETAVFEVKGVRIQRKPWRTLLLYKPRSVVTTRSDEKGRPTVFSLIQEMDGHLHAVGRLDWATTGLLLLTNDTRLSSWLTDPSHQVPRVYHVSVRGLFLDEKIHVLEKGILDQGEVLKANQIELIKSSHRESHLRVTLKEGKNREIRRMFLALGHEVTRLKRIALGNLTLGQLSPGEYREVSREELIQHFPGITLRQD